MRKLSDALSSRSSGSVRHQFGRLTHLAFVLNVGSLQEAAALLAGGGEGTLAGLGRLLDDSHASLRSLYDCSCGALDSLVLAMREGGARGARLTGAGWGGNFFLNVLPSFGFMFITTEITI